MKLLIVLGGGGHSTEMLRLAELLGPEYEYHYLTVKEVHLSQDRIKQPGAIHLVRRPRGMHDTILSTIANSVIALIQITAIILRIRPQAVIGCGPAVSVLASVVGKLFGAKAIFIETGSRVGTLSLSGKIMYRLADLFFVQWAPLRKKCPQAIYAGRL